MPTLLGMLKWTMFGVGVFALASKYLLKQNRLFLYAYRRSEDRASFAAVATISRYYFQIERTFHFGDWTTVASAANGSKKWLFLHNRQDGSAATGLINRASEFEIAKYYPAGTFIDWPYRPPIVNGRGDLLLIGPNGKGGSVIGFAQVLADGTFVEWWRTEFNIPGPGIAYAPIVGLKDTHLWFHNHYLKPSGAPNGSTTYVLDVKHAQVLSSRESGISWDGVVADGAILYFYNGMEKLAEMCIVDRNGQIVVLKETQYDIDLFSNKYEKVASTPGAHLCTNRGSSTAWVRALGFDGFKVTHNVRGLYEFWDYAVRC